VTILDFRPELAFYAFLVGSALATLAVAFHPRNKR
jgi:hypothetical protein